MRLSFSSAVATRRVPSAGSSRRPGVVTVIIEYSSQEEEVSRILSRPRCEQKNQDSASTTSLCCMHEVMMTKQCRPSRGSTK